MLGLGETTGNVLLHGFNQLGCKFELALEYLETGLIQNAYAGFKRRGILVVIQQSFCGRGGRAQYDGFAALGGQTETRIVAHGSAGFFPPVLPVCGVNDTTAEELFQILRLHGKHIINAFAQGDVGSKNHAEEVEDGVFVFSLFLACGKIIKACDEEMSSGNGSELVESELQAQDAACVTLLKINLDFALCQRPRGNLTHAMVLVHYIFTGGELVQTSCKIGRNFSSLYKFFKVGMHT